MTKDKKTNIVVISIISIVFLIIIIKNIKFIKDERIVLKNHKIGIGYINEYYEVGIESTRYVEYFFNVEEGLYNRTVQYSGDIDKCCIMPRKLCCNSQYWVIYFPDDPRKSLIDFTHEIQDIKNPQFPETLDNFE